LPSISIRFARPEDQDPVLEMCRDMHLEGVYADIPFDQRSIEQFLDGRAMWVAVLDGEVVGFLVGDMQPYMFNMRELLAVEQLWYVRPKNRGSRAAILLLKAFERWALDLGSREICMATSTGPDYGPLMKKLGYDCHGGVFKKRVR